MQISAYYLDLIDADDPACPIRRQALPDTAELVEHPQERDDPIGDTAHAAGAMLVHRYGDRALLFPTFRCPMYCRYCFRKVALNERDIHLPTELERAVDYLKAHPEITEVILSGGDPLLLSDRRLDRVLSALATVPSLKRLRIHSRVPVTLPMRITEGLAHRLGEAGAFVVAHFNHPKELTPLAAIGIERLRRAGVTVLNQAVLLHGGNDTVETLSSLFEGLLDLGVRPYYLHHPDLTVGTDHLRVSLSRGRALMRQLRGHLTGLAWPTYVIDLPGGGGKVPVDSSFVIAGDHPGEWWLESPLTGQRQRYVDPAE